MDATSLAMNISAVIVSIAALAVSARIAVRQTRYVRDSNHVPILTQVIAEFRDASFISSLKFVLDDLGRRYPEPVALSRLEPPAQEKAFDIAFYFQGIGACAALDIADSRRLQQLLGRQIIKAWISLEPYILEERKLGFAAISGFHFFEDIAAASAHHRLVAPERPQSVQRRFDYDEAARRRLALSEPDPLGDRGRPT